AQHLQEVYESKQKAADVAKSIVSDAIPFGNAIKPATSLLPNALGNPADKYLTSLPDKWMDSAISTWNHKPDPVHVQDPSPSQISSEINRETNNRLLDAAYRNGRLPSNLLNHEGSGPVHLEDATPQATETAMKMYMKTVGLNGYVDESKQSGDIAILMGLKDDRSKLQNFLDAGYEKVDPPK
ncbi:hypothetical protein ACH5AX_36290, partial [Streptomyces rochei]|uniref:hypothetical protein n=1 Tax=Streptomyces rochei TaxID=1928 RepID=UPI003788B8ED